MLMTTSNQTIEPHGFMTPGSGFAHRDARIVPMVRMYQNGPTPTGNGAELELAKPTLDGP